MASSLRKEFRLLKDIDDNSYIRFVEERHNQLFRLGDRVRIAHGILIGEMDTNHLNTPMDVDSDPTIGVFGTIVSYKFSTPDDDYKDYNENDPPVLSVKFEEEWHPMLKCRYCLSDVMHGIEAADVINYTVLGEEDGNKLYDKTRDRNLLFYEALTQRIIPHDFLKYALYFCDDDCSSEAYLVGKEEEFARHSVIVYKEMFN